MTTNVDAPVLTPPRVSLLSAATIVPVPVNDSRWESGFKTWTEGCEIAYTYPICPSVDEDPMEEDGQGEEVDYLPYLVYAADKCSTFTKTRDFYGRAYRKLILAESTKLENELWLGTSGGNPFLSDTPTTLAASGTQAAWEGIGILDQGLSECSSGRGMIHVRPFLLPYLQEHRAVRREGNVYLSPMDNIVVPGRGYPGTGPADQAVGATEWMYASTGIVEVRHSEVIYNPPQGDNVSRIIRTTNDQTVRAQRVTHVALDPTCCVLATEVASLAVS